MADISKIQIESGVFDIKDEVARNDIADINNQLDGGYIFISDSYGAGYSWDTDHIVYLEKGWCDYTKDALSIPNDKYYKFCETGAGFKHIGSQGHTFLDLIQNGTASVSDPSSITKIIVCGGGNDCFSLQENQTNSTELNALTLQFYNYCKQTFPNAKVYFGMITNFKANTTVGRNNRRSLQYVLQVYKYTCRFGGIYLNGVENIMHNYDDMFSGDNTHPHANGYYLLGSYIAQAIQNGSVSVKYAYKTNPITFESFVNTSGTNLSIDNNLNNDTTNISFNECDIVFSTPQTYGSNTPQTKMIKIGTVSLPYYRGDFFTLGKIPVRFYYSEQNGAGAYTGIGYVIINELNELYIETATATSVPGGYRTPTNVTNIHLYGGVISVPTMYS